MGLETSDRQLLRDDLYYQLTDLLSGDESVSKLIESVDVDSISKTLQKISGDETVSQKTRAQLLAESWRVNYRVKPPTIEEFLTPEWIGDTANSLFPHARKILTEFWQPNSPYRHLILASAIGLGKSTLSSISSLYVTTTLWCMRNPNRFFKLAPSTALVTALISFTMDKTAQVLLQPFLQILKTSPKYHRVRLEEKLDITQREDPDHVCWTTSSKMGALQFYNNLHYILTSDPAGLLGLNLIQAILSEISFFVDKGFSPEYIWRIYQDAKGRVTSRFGERYFAGTVLDSSPNDIDLSPIDKYIFSGEAESNPQNYVFTGTQWDYRPELRPVWQKTGKTFPVFRGSATRPAKILTPEELPDYPSDEVYNVPIDLRTVFEENCLKSVKDYCGWPAGSKGVLVREEKIIEDMFIPSLRNIYTFIRAPENMNPDHLIWDTVYKQFFTTYDKGYEFWRNPAEKRYLHIDQSESGDVACIAMCHPETDNKNGKFLIVIDFCIPISPDKNRINLDAIRFFIRDLIEKGRINIAKVTFDQYQSSATLQYLKRREIPAERLSVDASMDPYHLMISYMSSGKIKCGRNILLKNNIKSLQEVETSRGHKKVDHSRGKVIYQDDGSWEHSMMGKYAKDVSDATCGAIWNCVQNFVGVPRYIWETDLMSIEEKQSRRVHAKRALRAISDRYGMNMEDLEDEL